MGLVETLKGVLGMDEKEGDDARPVGEDDGGGVPEDGTAKHGRDDHEGQTGSGDHDVEGEHEDDDLFDVDDEEAEE